MNLLAGAALRQAAARLAEAGVDSPALDARLLLGEAIGLSPEALAAGTRRTLDDREIVALHALLDRRLAGEPVARILGRREFWSLDLLLSPDTLVPRPETETVVAEALRGLRDRAAPTILDLGTGSGAILLALLRELPHAFGIGLDRSHAALQTARINAGRLGLAGRAAFVCGDFGQAVGGRFDAVVGNPPYIPSDDIAGLAAEVRAFDPKLALDGGADGLAAYRSIAAALPGLLAEGGLAVFELGAGQEKAVAAIMQAAGLRPSLPARRDLGGIARALRVHADPHGSDRIAPDGRDQKALGIPGANS